MFVRCSLGSGCMDSVLFLVFTRKTENAYPMLKLLDNIFMYFTHIGILKKMKLQKIDFFFPLGLYFFPEMYMNYIKNICKDCSLFQKI